ncbi:MAG TPA: DUF2254 family protein [Reyranella sp.]|nr:DUF2254 family protein [Reyranella sp.]
MTRYRLQEFARSSFWLPPSLAILAAWLLAKLVIWFVPDPQWPRFDTTDIEGLRTSMGAFAASMLTFIVYAVSALLLTAQLASGQTTPRFIRFIFSRWQMKFATSVFVFAFGITLVSLANLNEQSRHSLLIAMAILGNVTSIVVFFWFVQQVGLGLRPVAVLQHIFDQGRVTLDSVYARAPHRASAGGAPAGAMPGARAPGQDRRPQLCRPGRPPSRQYRRFPGPGWIGQARRRLDRTQRHRVRRNVMTVASPGQLKRSGGPETPRPLLV